MPRATTGKAASGTTRARATASKETAVTAKEEAVVATEAPVVESKPAKKTYRVREELPGNMIVTVRNGFAGKLVYKSRKTGERFVWQEFGDEQDMELQELKGARNASKSYFANNWFMIDDPAVIDYLGVEQYYAHALDMDNFDQLFALTPEEVRERIQKLSRGQKGTVAYRARQLIRDGVIDSMKVINALEEGLGVALIER